MFRLSSLFSRRPLLSEKGNRKSISVQPQEVTVSQTVAVSNTQFFAGYLGDEEPVFVDESLILQVKRVARRWDQRVGKYVDEEDAEAANTAKDVGLNASYAFSIVRQFEAYNSVQTNFCIRSPYFIKVAKTVMSPCRDITWSTVPVQLAPNKLLAWVPRFKTHLASLESRLSEGFLVTDSDQQTINHLRFFVNFFEEEYRSTIAQLDALLGEDKITFDLLWAILLPGTIVVSHCGVTDEPIAARLISAEIVPGNTFKEKCWSLKCEIIDFTRHLPSVTDVMLEIGEFDGPCSILDLDVFPMDPYMPEPARSELRSKLISRGKRYAELSAAWCHKLYSGIAYKHKSAGKIGVKSRIILDRALYEQYEGSPPVGWRSLDGQRLSARKFRADSGGVRRIVPNEEEFMLMPAVLRGFSLGDRMWLQFNVNLVQDIIWNPKAFDHLDIPQDQKNIVRTLTESHAKNAGKFDDFIEGKGVGLIFNLHGPPGVGKTLTAEATSEVAQSPLYVVSAGDLGTNASELDASLTTIFSLATAWRAVVLIDEADVFLERRSLQELVRNAMVAVFLRQLEYFPGILILTTNRVNIIDDAMKSRIHLSLHYEQLDPGARKRLWQLFLNKAGIDAVDDKPLEELGQRTLNGREIKNFVKVAVTVASHHGRSASMTDVVEVVHADEKRKSQATPTPAS